MVTKMMAPVVDDETFPYSWVVERGLASCLASVELGVSTSRLRLDLGRKGCSGMGAGVLVQGTSVIRYLSPCLQLQSTYLLYLHQRPNAQATYTE